MDQLSREQHCGERVRTFRRRENVGPPVSTSRISLWFFMFFHTFPCFSMLFYASLCFSCFLDTQESGRCKQGLNGVPRSGKASKWPNCAPECSQVCTGCTQYAQVCTGCTWHDQVRTGCSWGPKYAQGAVGAPTAPRVQLGTDRGLDGPKLT